VLNLSIRNTVIRRKHRRNLRLSSALRSGQVRPTWHDQASFGRDRFHHWLDFDRADHSQRR
jgi:hypothetical protein